MAQLWAHLRLWAALLSAEEPEMYLKREILLMRLKGNFWSSFRATRSGRSREQQYVRPSALGVKANRGSGREWARRPAPADSRGGHACSTTHSGWGLKLGGGRVTRTHRTHGDGTRQQGACPGPFSSSPNRCGQPASTHPCPWGARHEAVPGSSGGRAALAPSSQAVGTLHPWGSCHHPSQPEGALVS